MGIQTLVLATVLAVGAERPAALEMILDWDGRCLPLCPLREIDDVSGMLMSAHSLADGDKAELHLRQAEARYWRADGAGSARAAQEALQFDPQSVRARWLLARAWLGSPEHRPAALELGQRLIAEHPDAAEGYLVVGWYYVEEGRPQEAVAALEKAVERDARNPRAHLIKAVAHYHLKQHHPCLRQLDAGLRQAPFDGSTCGKLQRLYGMMYARAGGMDEATAYLLSAHQLNPQSPEIMEMLWLCLGQQGKSATGLAVAQKLVARCPSSATACWMHARSLAQADRLDAARESAEKAVERSPDDPAAWAALGAVFGAGGEFPEAIEAWQKSIRIRGNPDTDTALRLAFTWSTCPDDTLRQGAEARQLALSALRTLRLAEHRRTAVIVLALTEAECGDTAKAAQTATSLLEIGTPDPDTVEACRRLADLYRGGKPYRYDPQVDAAPVFALPPARVLTNF
jgi:tetratricopeptide (TPR) repeat protein